MRGFRLDLNHDLDLVQGDLVIIDGVDAAVQEINTRLQLWLGEYFLDLTQGFPYYQLVFRKNPNLVLVRERMAALIESVDGIQPGVSAETALARASRELSISWSAIYKGDPISGSVPVELQPEIASTFLRTSGGQFLFTTEGEPLLES